MFVSAIAFKGQCCGTWNKHDSTDVMSVSTVNVKLYAWRFVKYDLLSLLMAAVATTSCRCNSVLNKYIFWNLLRFLCNLSGYGPRLQVTGFTIIKYLQTCRPAPTRLVRHVLARVTLFAVPRCGLQLWRCLRRQQRLLQRTSSRSTNCEV